MFEEIVRLYGCRKVYGPYVGKDGRSRCVLYFEDGRRVSKQYSRLIVEESIGRILCEDEEVDHIDGNPKNNAFVNLQILTVAEHRLKSAKDSSILQSRLIPWRCPACATEFMARRYRFKHTDNPCCSRSCASRYAGANQYAKFGIRQSSKSSDLRESVDLVSKVCDNPSVV